jgi:hypothetical protein
MTSSYGLKRIGSHGAFRLRSPQRFAAKKALGPRIAFISRPEIHRHFIVFGDFSRCSVRATSCSLSGSGERTIRLHSSLAVYLSSSLRANSPTVSLNACVGSAGGEGWRNAVELGCHSINRDGRSGSLSLPGARAACPGGPQAATGGFAAMSSEENRVGNVEWIQEILRYLGYVPSTFSSA